MRRTDRLFNLIEIFRDGRLHRAEDLSARLGVSLRTIYRDMETLAASGIPIEGERGRGYTAQPAITLPPLNISEVELQALQIGLAVIGAGVNHDLAQAALSLSAKIDDVLPEDRSHPAPERALSTGAFEQAARGFQHMPKVRDAIRVRQKIAVTLDGSLKDRLRPLKLDYWGRVWTCIAWSEGKGAFISLRVDQIRELQVLPELFVDEPGKRLSDFEATRGS